MRALLVCSIAAAACGATEKRAEFAPLPDARTEATLAGHRCQTGDFCPCRAAGKDDEEKVPPAEGVKRFEFRVASSDGQAWVTVDGRERLYKGLERIEDCFYLDLAPGEHSVSLRAKATREEGGVGAGLRVSEYSAKGPFWYDTFVFSCGAPGACAKDQLVEWKQDVEKDRKRMWDPCGSVKVRGLAWETGRMPDALHPEEVSVSFILKVYDFVPRTPPRDPSCSEI